MDDIRVAAVQFEPRPLDVAHNLDLVERFTQRAAAAGAHLVAMPECCISSYMPLADLSPEELADVSELVPDGPSTQRMLALASEHNIAVAAGLAEVDAEGKLYNTYVIATPEGDVHRYRKFHPFVNAAMTPGDEYLTFEYRGWTFGVLICYDNNQPENGRTLATMGTHVLLAPHQTGGFAIKYGGMGLVDPALWEQREEHPASIRAEIMGPKGRDWLLRWLPSRAYDNGCYLAFSNGVGMDGTEVRTGNTMILDVHGRIMVETYAPADDMVVATLSPEPLDKNLGHTHMRTRRPELYGRLTEPTGRNIDTKAGRDAAIANEET
jgi:N-carbamoylputrescine amidase